MSDTETTDLLTESRALIDRVLDQVRQGIATHTIGGVAAGHLIAHAVDEVVRRLLSSVTDSTSGAGLAVIALGGYGRREMSPQSDVDLLFLSADPEHPRSIAAQDAVLHGLWDLRLKVGHGTRTLDECSALSAADPTSATTHWDARLVAGDARLAEALLRRTTEVIGADTSGFIDAIAALTDARHGRFGDTIFLLEPNVKLGKGGLRDLHTVRWLSRALFGEGDPTLLAERGDLPARTATAMDRAHEFLLRLRAALHFEAAWKSDRLTYEHQDRVAARLGFLDDSGQADTPGLMSEFYGHAHVIGSTVLRLLERGRTRTATGASPSASEPIGEDFVQIAGYLAARSPSLFEDAPVALVRVFSLARERGLRIHPGTQELVLASAHLLSELREEPEVGRALMGALMGEDDAASLFLMHDLGVLSAILPEFASVTALFQRNPFHVYTVDVHTLYAVRQLQRLRAGALAEEHPRLTHLMGRYGDKRSVYIGVLLHDVGKGKGGDHCEKSVAAVPEVGRRLGLCDAEIREVEFLVRHHLDMALLSQHRDLSDTEMVADLARQAGTVERLAHLYLLTFADMSSVNPDLLNQWKAMLLQELYDKAEAILERGLDLWDDPQERVDRVRSRVMELLYGARLDHPDRRTVELEHFFGGLPTRYFETTTPETIVRHMGLVARQRSQVLVLEVLPVPEREEVEATLVCPDAPGLLARVAGIFALHGIDIRTADITSRSDRIALDVFRLADPHGRLAVDAKRWEAVRADLRAMLTAPRSQDDARIIEAVEREQRPRRPVPQIRPEVTFDNDTSREYTVIDLTARDYRGLLFRITRALFRLGLGIALAIVDTQGPVARDAFYVAYLTGEKITDPARLAAIRDELLSVLE